MKTFTKYLFAFIITLAVQTVSAQDIIFTVRGEINGQTTSLDSILVENISNNTRILFDSLPDLPDYNLNLTQKAFWGATGIKTFGQNQGFQVSANLPGLLRLANKGNLTATVDLTVFNLLGQKLYAIHKEKLPGGSVINVRLGRSNIYLVKISSEFGEQTFKAVGSGFAKKDVITINITGSPYSFQTFKNAQQITDNNFSFQLGDTLRITGYKQGFYTESVEFKVSGSESVLFEFRQGYSPVAEFSADKTSGRQPLTVTFVDLSTGDPTGWHWDFGDHNKSLDQNPVHTFNNVGKYTVTLVAYNSFGYDTVTKENYIDILGCTDNANLEWVHVDGGTFQMGSNDGEIYEKPVHTVTLDSFAITKYEITNLQYCKFLNDIGCNINGHFNDSIYGDVLYLDISDADCQIKYTDNQFKPKSGLDEFPVIEVSWFGANAYALWACGRLPTEAEWEFAARGGNLTGSAIYSGSNTVDSVSWYWDNSNSAGNSNLQNGHGTFKIGLKKANELGIYDMSGNVWEWCNDWYNADYYANSPVKNPQGPVGGKNRILRGGGWDADAGACRVSARGALNPDYTNATMGFRVAR